MNPEFIERETLEYLGSLVARMRDPATGVSVKDRKWYLKTYPACFVGSEAVDWLVRSEGVKDRDAAVQLGLELHAAGLLQHVTRDHVFKDANLFYRFSADDVLHAEQKKWTDLLNPLGSLFGESSGSTTSYNTTTPRHGLRESVLDVVQALRVEPLDAYNLKLLDNVHPPKWVSPTPDGRYNLVVIGAGTAGLVTASAAAGLGAKVALVERHLMGGDCLNVGCVPSKALLACAKRVHAVKTASRFGVLVEGPVRVDFAAIMERMRRIRAEIAWNDGAPRYATQFGVDVFYGAAKFTSGQEVALSGGETLKFAKAVICTGARASVPNIEGLAQCPYLTNETVFNLTELPPSLAILGAGVVGCELGQAFARFGSRVTICMRGTALLKGEDADAAALLEQALLADGVQLRRQAGVQRVAHDAATGLFTLTLADGDRVEAAALLVAAGRAPNVENMGLELAGVQWDLQRGIVVNDCMQTTAAHIYAAGDCCSDFKFTHVADFQARIVLRNALFFGHAKASALCIPWCTYTDPEIAHVGLYEDDAAQRGTPVDVFRMDFAENDRSICEDDTVGFVKILVDKATDHIVGATICGSHAGDMISELTLAIVNEVGLSSMASVIHPYPTKQDAVRRCGDFYNRTKLSPAVKILFRKFLAARRNKK